MQISGSDVVIAMLDAANKKPKAKKILPAGKDVQSQPSRHSEFNDPMGIWWKPMPRPLPSSWQLGSGEIALGTSLGAEKQNKPLDAVGDPLRIGMDGLASSYCCEFEGR